MEKSRLTRAARGQEERMTDTEFRLTVNGARRNVTCEPDTPLLSMLHQDLGLAGAKFGCGTGRCGACIVLIDGYARSSCDVPVSAVNTPVTTVEGLSCGGGLLRDHPAPTDQQVREALDGNLCRCGAHGRIVRAVLNAAGRKSAEQAVVPDAATRRCHQTLPISIQLVIAG
jgi:nicotinate dehydrogenase subunit A